MALPTYRGGGAQGAPLPARTTLTDLRSRPVTELPGVGVRIEAALGDLGIASLADMISHYPSRHEDLSNVKRISELRVGERATIFGTVVSTRPVGKPVRGRAPGFSAQLYDGTGYIPVMVWGRSWLQGQLLPEVRVVASGEVQSRYGIQIVAKSIEVVDDPGGDEGPHAGRFVPVYPVNKGIQARRMRRLIFHELFLIQAGLAARKARLERTEVGGRHRGDGSLLNPFLGGLSFGLTGAQERVMEEVLADMRLEKPMRRLLQGDVGSGKTVVAIAALLTAVEAGGQGAMMAPTEVLAWQHHLSISTALADLPVNVVLLTGSQGMAQRRKALEQIAAGEANVVVGTHALIQKGVDFDDLSLVVVDEQHRFGVGQRTVFREKGTTPDTLVMTATPIPRTLSLTLYGDLEVSIIDELPPGRQPVETTVVDPAERLGAYEEVRNELQSGRQAYVICPLVEESEALEDVRAAEELREELAEEVFPERRGGLPHGGGKGPEKREV